ncbi:alpha/beta hydrolase [Neobacillus vireti]|uniref:alpha/beta hydrolase n=1 Tax=Neobacillus vireti TaxID=220686 RepID=UPI003000318E
MTVILPLWNEINLEESGPNENAPSIQPFLLEGSGPFPVIIVAAGGAYARRAEHEAYPVAEWLNSIGISAVVLNYRVAPYKHPIPLNEAKRAIRMVRSQGEVWNLDPNRVGILGFSAGGHLASSVGTHYDKGNLEAEDPVERYSSRPDLMILCYPVISMGAYTHEGSRTNLLGEYPDTELVELLSNEKQISEETPPAFLWHTADDASVSVENSLLFAAGLGRHKVPFDLHIFESGRHGLGLAVEHTEAGEWPRLCEKWLRKQNF